ncbi:hypothetical protein LINGRAPRIM_LOCUS3062 [Linum grandiflorum]
MTRTQKRRFLRKDAQTRQGQYTSTRGKELGTFRRNESLQANIEVDNYMSTGLKNDNTVQEGMGENLLDVLLGGEDDGLMDSLLEGYDADMEDCTEENMLEDEHPNPKFSREKRDEDEDGQGATTTLRFDLEENIENEDLVIDEDESVVELVEAFASLEASDEPWGTRMARLGGQIDLAAEVLHEAGHKNVSLLGEDRGRFPYFVLCQGPETTSSVPVENPIWGPICDEETGSSSIKEENMVEEEATMVLTTLKGKEVMPFGLEGANIELDHLAVFKEPEPSMLRHLRPLYIKARLDGIPTSKILVDNGAAANVLPTRMLRKLGKNIGDLIPTDVFVTSFNGGSTSARGILPVMVGVGSQETMSAFFVVDGAMSYNALLGRDWIHANKCVPSSLHQCLMFWNKGGIVELVQADTRPFDVGANMAKAPLYDGDFGPLEVRSMDGGTCTVVVSSAKVLSKACLDPLSEVTRPSMLSLDGPLDSEKNVDDE